MHVSSNDYNRIAPGFPVVPTFERMESWKRRRGIRRKSGRAGRNLKGCRRSSLYRVPRLPKVGLRLAQQHSSCRRAIVAPST